MGLTGFNRARREAAELAQVPSEGMSYDAAIAILAQPLLTETPALDVPALDVPLTPAAELPVAPELPAKPPARKSKPKPAE